MRYRHFLLTAIAAVGIVTSIPTLQLAQASSAKPDVRDRKPINVIVFAPQTGYRVGVEGKGWFVDLEITYPGTNLATAGFTTSQLTGPAGHNNVAPLPGTFSPGKDDRLPGLVVLTSTTDNRTGFSGSGTNLANLFNLTGVTGRTLKDFKLWDTWIVGADIAGRGVKSVLTVAVIADLDKNGIYDDAPAVITDLNGDGKIDMKDLKRIGVASNIVEVPFRISA